MDREKFTQEVLKSENTMYHIAKGMLKSESDCEDVVSEAVLKAYTKIHTLKEEKYFKTWLIRILINECYKKLREYKRVVSIEDCNNSFEYKDNSNYTELYNAVKKAETQNQNSNNATLYRRLFCRRSREYIKNSCRNG